jgi:hypothetical protein
MRLRARRQSSFFHRVPYRDMSSQSWALQCNLLKENICGRFGSVQSVHICPQQSVLLGVHLLSNLTASFLALSLSPFGLLLGSSFINPSHFPSSPHPASVMSSQPRTAEQPVSLPSIHELFPGIRFSSPATALTHPISLQSTS